MAALPEVQVPQLAELTEIRSGQLQALLDEEIRAWRQQVVGLGRRRGGLGGRRRAAWWFAKLLLKEARVAVSLGEGHVRFALVENGHRIRQATRGIARVLREGV